MGFFQVFAIGCLLLACTIEAQYASGACDPCQQQQMRPQQPIGCTTCGQNNYQYDQSSQGSYGSVNNGQYGQAQNQPYQQQQQGYPQQQQQGQGGYGQQSQGFNTGYSNTNQYNPQQQQQSQYGYQNDGQQQLYGQQYGQQSGYQNGQTQQYQQMGTNSYAQGQPGQQGQQGSSGTSGSSNSSEPGYLPDYRGDKFTDPQRIKDTQALNAPFFQSIGGEPQYPGGVTSNHGSGGSNSGTGGTGGTNTNGNNNYAQQYNGRRK
jgi:hypothetical protein